MSNKEKRVTIAYSDVSYHERIAALAKEYKLSQGEVIEVLLDTVYDNFTFTEALILKREKKVGSRTSIRAIIQRTKGMPGEQRKQALEKAGLK